MNNADLYQRQRAEDNGTFPGGDEKLIFTLALGLAGESGEVVDLLKKHLGHGKELDKQALLLELGDVLWYVSQIAHFYEITMSQIMEANTAKLRERYPNGFSGNLPHWTVREDQVFDPAHVLLQFSRERRSDPYVGAMTDIVDYVHVKTGKSVLRLMKTRLPIVTPCTVTVLGEHAKSLPNNGTRGFQFEEEMQSYIYETLLEFLKQERERSS